MDNEELLPEHKFWHLWILCDRHISDNNALVARANVASANTGSANTEAPLPW